MFVLLLLFASLQTHVYGYNNNNNQFDLTDLTLPSEPHGSEPIEEISNKCSSTKKHFYGGQCWNLLTRGPCDEGQWLVLKRPDHREDYAPAAAVRVTCAKRKCSDRDLYWPLDGFCYDAETARRRLCPHQNAEAITDDFGEGHCRCRTDDDDKAPYVKVVPVANEDGGGERENSQLCYPLYARGPCPEGHVLTPAGSGYGNCEIDMCTAKHHLVEPSRPALQLGLRRQRRQLRPNLLQRRQQQPVYVQWTADGLCYELGSQGPCNDNERFVVYQDTLQPGCTSSVSIELNLAKGGCLKTHTGACQDRIEFQTSGSTAAQSLEQGIIDRFYYNKHKKTY